MMLVSRVWLTTLLLCNAYRSRERTPCAGVVGVELILHAVVAWAKMAVLA